MNDINEKIVWFTELDSTDQAFIKNFVVESGSLKGIAKLYDVSYPTIRLRLDRIIDKIKLYDRKEPSLFQKKLMQLVIEERIDYDTAEIINRIYNARGRL